MSWDWESVRIRACGSVLINGYEVGNSSSSSPSRSNNAANTNATATTTTTILLLLLLLPLPLPLLLAQLPPTPPLLLRLLLPLLALALLLLYYYYYYYYYVDDPYNALVAYEPVKREQSRTILALDWDWDANACTGQKTLPLQRFGGLRVPQPHSSI